VLDAIKHHFDQISEPRKMKFDKDFRCTSETDREILKSLKKDDGFYSS
jgi:hypothetical protein